MSAPTRLAGPGTGPKGFRWDRTWWYTHARLRSAYEPMKTAQRRGHLFTYLDHELEVLEINARTNMNEGAINSGIRAMMFYHRGMTLEHRKRACEWFYWTHTAEQNRPALGALLRPEYYSKATKKTAHQVVDDAPISPELFGPRPSAEDGQYIRDGWMRNIY